MLSFMPIIVEQWYGLHKEIIRKHDPNHLILGDKNIVGWHHDWLLPVLKRNVDVICVQGYGTLVGRRAVSTNESMKRLANQFSMVTAATDWLTKTSSNGVSKASEPAQSPWRTWQECTKQP